MSTYTLESASAELRGTCEYEGSYYEASALHAYEHGLQCPAERQFWTLAEAEEFWRWLYERDVTDLATDMIGFSSPNVFASCLMLWASPESRFAWPTKYAGPL